MNPFELSVVLPVVIGAAINVAVTIGLHLWGRWVARRLGGVWNRLAWLPVLGLVFGAVGLGITGVMLMRAFDTVANVAPAEKATRLSDAISGAMTATAIFAPLSTLCVVGSIVAFAVGSFRKPT